MNRGVFDQEEALMRDQDGTSLQDRSDERSLVKYHRAITFHVRGVQIRAALRKKASNEVTPLRQTENEGK